MTVSDDSLDRGDAGDRGGSGGPVSPEAISHIASLARLQVPDTEVAALSQHFSRILDFVDKLEEVDVDGVAPTLHPAISLDQARPDVPEPTRGLAMNPDQAEVGAEVAVERVAANAPDADGACFLVPRVVDAPADRSTRENNDSASTP